MGQGYPMRFSPRENQASSIGWREWSEEPFREAKRENKLILLSISASWCHWCHVMDETTYSDPEVIELIDRYYVPIRVDTDLQPEINRRYNQGGWPTTAFLDPEGRLLAGTTYIAPDIMRKALLRMYRLYMERREDLQWQGAPFPAPEPVGDLRRKSLETAMLLLALWDRVHGGLGGAPKFPLPEAILLSLDVFHFYGSEEHLQFAQHYLSSMVASNTFDSVEGGFFRYSVTPDWSEPHYEKILEDNALLLLAIHGVSGTRQEELLDHALVTTARYINATLYEEEGIFLPSQDADEEYYLMAQEDRERAAKPAVDPIPLSRPAATASRALIRVGARLGEESWLRRALKALDRIFATFESDGGVAHVYGEKPMGRGHLEDQTALALGLLEAYSLTGSREHLQQALEVLGLVSAQFMDEASGLMVDVLERHLPPLLKAAPAGPDPQAEAGIAMTWAWALTGDGRWRDEASALLSRALSLYSGVQASPLARAGLLLAEKPLMAKLPGDSEYPRVSRYFLSLPQSFLRPVPEEAQGQEPAYHLCHPDSCLASSDDPGTLLKNIDIETSRKRQGHKPLDRCPFGRDDA